MNRQRLLAPIAAIALVLSLATTLVAAQPSATVEPGIYIALGDSIAAGIGSSLPRERGNAVIVSKWLTSLSGESTTLTNLAVPGETAESFVTGEQLRRFNENVAQAEQRGIPIAAVSLSLGGNELLSLEQSSFSDRQAGLDTFRQTYPEAASAIRSTLGPDVPLVLTNVYDLTEGDPSIESTESWWIAQFNQVINEVAGEQNALVADIAARFDGQITELTHYPYDVHPNNAGHRAIAQAIWQTLRFDDEPPTIDAPTSIVATHLTPTIALTVTDNVAVSQVNVSSDEVEFRGPFEIEENRYAILLDLRDVVDGDVALTIEISDDSGNVVRAVVTIEIA